MQGSGHMEPKRLGRYIVGEVLGEGATATVYRGRDPGLEREVVIKQLKAGQASDVETLDRFRREARSAAGLSHPSIVTVLDQGEDEGRFYIVMTSVAGISLDQHLLQNGPLAWPQVLKLAQQIGSALDYSHGKGVLHRDIKPGNILVTPEGNFVLTDFGLARAVQETGKTSTGLLMGTPYYVAPELWDGKGASPAGDQYALACVIYEAWTGKILFQGDSPAAIMKRHIIDGAQLDSALPYNPVAVLSKALARDPKNRYPNLQAFADRLTESQMGKMAIDRRPETIYVDPLPVTATFAPARNIALLWVLRLILGGMIVLGLFCQAALPLVALGLAVAAQIILLTVTAVMKSAPRFYLVAFLTLMVLGISLYGISVYGSASARGLIFLPVFNGLSTLFWLPKNR